MPDYTQSQERIRRQRSVAIQTPEVELEVIVPILVRIQEEEGRSLNDDQQIQFSSFLQKCRDNWYTLVRQRDPHAFAALQQHLSEPTAPLTDLDSVPAPDPAVVEGKPVTAA
jgi:hypothetical protein